MNFPEGLQEFLISMLLRIVAAVIIFLIGWWLARLARNWAVRVGEKSKLAPSLMNLLKFVVYYGIILLVVILDLSILGVPITSIVALSGAVVVVLGIALKEMIADFAATVSFMMFQPYKVGDTVEVMNTVGLVKEIQFFNTVLQLGDNKLVTMANSKIREERIVNYSVMNVVRVDLAVGISYEDDIARARQVLEDIFLADERVLRDPAPLIGVQSLDDNTVTIYARPFVEFKDYWTIQPDLREQIKRRFEVEGITMPYPRQDVHIVQGS